MAPVTTHSDPTISRPHSDEIVFANDMSVSRMDSSHETKDNRKKGETTIGRASHAMAMSLLSMSLVHSAVHLDRMSLAGASRTPFGKIEHPLAGRVWAKTLLRMQRP